MGTPAYVVFCRNGHMVKVVKHHEVSNFAIRKCKHCGATEFATQIEWDNEGFEREVPREPLGFAYIDEKKVFVFDVSRVTNWGRVTPDVIRVCRDCREEFVLRGGEIDFFKTKGLSLPRRCQKCRKSRRDQYKQEEEVLVTA